MEREVSLSTGMGVCGALRKRGHMAVLLDSFLGYETGSGGLEDVFEKESLIDGEAFRIGEKSPDLLRIRRLRGDGAGGILGPNVIEICAMADITFMALHGAEGENGRIQAVFDVHGIKYTGSGYLGSAMAMNKSVARAMMKSGGVPVAEGFLVKKGDESSSCKTGVKFPCVVKPCCGGSSVGVSVARDGEEYKKALELAFTYENEAVVEKYIKGREFSVGVIAGRSLPVIEIIPKQGFYDYKTKYQTGLANDVCPAQLEKPVEKKMREYAADVYRILKLEAYARIDFLLDEEENIYCLEANTLPGMTPTSLLPQEALADGMEYEMLCEKLIEESMKKYDK